MHADAAMQAAGCQPVYQGDDYEARLHIKVGEHIGSLCVCWCVLVCMRLYLWDLDDVYVDSF